MSTQQTPSIQTTCPYCGTGCGVSIDYANGDAQVTGSSDHPANHGRLCVKGAALAGTLGEHGRLVAPMVDGCLTDWDSATTEIAQRLENIRHQHGSHAIAAYLSGQLLTEDYYVANKFFKGFIGTPNVDTNSRLCMSSAVAGHKRAFGADVVPCCYEDLEQARLLVIVGSNLAWNHPVLFQRVKAAKQHNAHMKVVVIDPRATDTCDIADLFLGIRPGGDIGLFNGLLSYMASHQEVNQVFIEEQVNGFEQTLAHAQQQSPDIESVAQDCDVDVERLTTFYHWFSREPRVVTLFSQGTNQSDHGTDRVNAIINCHLAGGRIGYAGAGPFSITGQPNAMGGREVGGLANQLAAHMDYTTPGAIELVSSFWQTNELTPTLPEAAGLKAIDLIEAIEDGRVQALWIMATNPAVSLPDSARVRRALEKCPLVIVSEAMSNSDTLAYADIVLPASSWSEKDGTVTNSERCISRQRGFIPPPGEARHDWQALCDVAIKMGYASAFTYQGSWEIFAEHARLSGANNTEQGIKRLFDISALAELDQQGYDALLPIRWPVTAQAPKGTDRLFAQGTFMTNDGRARMLPVTNEQDNRHPDEFTLNTGRIRDQWHTMTRTARAARLNRHVAEPFINIHPDDARPLALEDGCLVELNNSRGRYLGRLRHVKGQRRGELFIPIHWSRQFSRNALASALISPATDPHSGQPASKFARVTINRLESCWYATAVVKTVPTPLQLDTLGLDYWTLIPLQHGVRIEMASTRIPDQQDVMLALFGSTLPAVRSSAASGQYQRAAWFNQGQLCGWLRTSSRPFETEVGWLDERFADHCLDHDSRRSVLAGTPSNGERQGKIICSCHQVGINPIERMLNEIDLDEEGSCLAQLGSQLKCGTQCGSCVPELKRLIRSRAEALSH